MTLIKNMRLSRSERVLMFEWIDKYFVTVRYIDSSQLIFMGKMFNVIILSFS